MKTLFRTHKYVLVGVVGFAVLFAFGQEPAVAARRAKSKKKNVEITSDTIVIHPTVKMSPADAKAMDDILKKNSKTLYKVDTLQNGQVTQTRGSLSDASLTAAAKAEAPKPKVGKSNKTHQVICPAPCHQQQVPPFSTVFKPVDAAARQRLIQDLKPVLEKYQ